MFVKQEQNREVALTKIKEFCTQLNIPVQGVTILGGNPYVNKIGLLHKAHQIGLKSITTIVVKDASENEERRAHIEATVTMKDNSFFEAKGWASPQSIQMRTLHTPDFINMTCETRAVNRALSRATNCGYISAEEIESENIVEGVVDNGSHPIAEVSPSALTPREVIPEAEIPKTFRRGETSKPKTLRRGKTSEPQAFDSSEPYEPTKEESIPLPTEFNGKTIPTPQTISNGESGANGDASETTPSTLPTKFKDKLKPQTQTGISKEELDEIKKDCLRFVNAETLSSIAENLGFKGKKLSELTQVHMAKLLGTCRSYKVEQAKPETEEEPIEAFPIQPYSEERALQVEGVTEHIAPRSASLTSPNAQQTDEEEPKNVKQKDTTDIPF